MKIIFVLFVSFFLISINSFSQEDGYSFLNVWEKHPSVPASPEVASFETYGNHSVDLYTGKPNIRIPVYTHVGKEISIPISLTYDAGGIKGNQMATKIGLGWNLNIGGVVSRQINGLADDAYGLPQEDYDKIWESNVVDGWDVIFDPSNGITEVYQIYNSSYDYSKVKSIYSKYLNNEIDFQADLFPFYVNGISGTIAIDYQTTVGSDTGSNTDYLTYCVDDPTLKVAGEWSNGELISWTIVDNDGTTYQFAKREVVWQDYSDPVTAPNGGNEYTRIHTSAWYLTQVISANGIDTFDFNYETSDFWTDTYDFHAKSAVRTEAGETLLGHNTRKIKSVILSNIVYNNNPNPIFECQTSSRSDINGLDRYSGFTVYDDNGNIILQVDLDNDQYFMSDIATSPNAFNSRLKLDGIKFYRNPLESDDSRKFEFTYYGATSGNSYMPARNNHSVDYWGYFNGRSNPTNTLIPKDFPNGYTIGVDRTPVFGNTLEGTLTSIMYPTGGKTTFYFEPHNGLGSNWDGIKTIDGTVGGLRLQKQITDPNDGGPVIGRHYFYNDIYEAVNGNASNITLDMVNSIDPYGNPMIYDVSAIPQQELIYFEQKEITTPNGQITRRFQYANNRAARTPHNVTYSKVSEVLFKGNSFAGCVITEFYNEIYAGSEGRPIEPFVNKNSTNGEIYKQRLYDNSLTFQSEVEYDFTNELLPQQYSTYLGFSFNQPAFAPHFGQSGCESSGPNGQGGYEYEIQPANPTGSCPSGNTYVDFYSKYIIKPYGFEQFHGRLNKVTKVWHELGSINPLVQITENFYNSTNHLFPTDVVTTDSKGGTKRTKLLYPPDASLLNNYPSSNMVILDNLTSRNMITETVQVQEYYSKTATLGNEELQTTQRRLYKVVANVNGIDLIRTERTEYAKGSDALKSRMLYHTYDNKGNLVEASKPSGMHVYYIWGYNGKLLIAEIKNKNGSIPQDLQVTIDSAINYSNGEDSLSEENTLRNYLDSIRNHSFFANSLVTTFTYDPGIGVTSETDPRGTTIFFTYDQHNRLKEVRDNDGNLVGKNNYNYRINN